MSDGELYEDGFDAFSELLKEYEKKTDKENVIKILEIGAKAFAEDVRALPQPRSRVRTPGYTHLLDTVTYQRFKDEVATGWGKYYGPMVDRGTVRAKAVSHMNPTFEKNKGQYYKKMQNALFG